MSDVLEFNITIAGKAFVFTVESFCDPVLGFYRSVSVNHNDGMEHWNNYVSVDDAINDIEANLIDGCPTPLRTVNRDGLSEGDRAFAQAYGVKP